MSTSTSGKWDAEADRTLMWGIIKEHNITVDNKKMSEYMQTRGYTFTQAAIQNRVQRLRAADKKGNADTTGDADDETTPKAKKTPRGRKRGADKNDASPEESPTKKGKGSKEKVVVKEENGDEDQNDE